MIVNYMPVFATRLKNINEATDFIEKFGHLNKTLYFGVSEEPPVYFKGLSAIFKDRMEVIYT